MAASMKITALWDVAPCSLVEIGRRFKGAMALRVEAVSRLKCPSLSARLHGATSQKEAIFITYLQRTPLKWVAALLRIREFLYQNFSPQTAYPEIFRSFPQ
jgi:hypothetical protein